MADSASSAASAAAAAPSPTAASPRKAKPPAAKIRLPGRVADYFIIVGGIRQDAPEERRFADKQPHTRRVSTALDKAAADAAAQLSAAAASAGAEGTLDGAAAIDAAAAASATPAPAAAAAAAPAPVRKAKSRTLWTPKVFDRYPRVDFPDSECPKEIEMFCFPAAYEPGLMHPPESHTFVLTEADGTRVYGSVLKVWEPLDEARLEVIERGVQNGWDSVNPAEAAAALSLSPVARSASPISSSVLLYVPKCLVIVSHWPYFSQFDRFLACVYKGVSAPSESNPNLVPLERVLLNFIMETPLPPQGKLEVECRAFMNPSLAAWVNTNCPWGPHAGTIGNHSASSSSGAMTADKKFLFSRPPPNKLPLRDFPLGTLFRWLSLENVLMLYSAVLTERRILFVSNHCFKLTIAAETITHLCCPFFWRHIYIPLLPARLSDFICAPMPYIVGILAAYMPDSLMLDGTLVVNLDDNELTQSSGDPIAALPPERYTALFRSLKKLLGCDPSVPYKGASPLSDSEIESAFLKFHVVLLSRYRDYLEAPSEFVLDKFHKSRFIAEHAEGGQDKSAGKDASTGRPLDGVGVQFLTEFMETQMFQCFVDDRYDQSTRGGAKALASISLEILYFDESIDAALGKPASFLQDSTQNINPAARVVSLEPNREGLAKGQTFKYPGGRVPVPLDSSLFGTPREVPDLAGDSTAVSGGASSGGSGGGGGVAGGSKRLDMDRISMKFFTEKRLYSQHFHTLRLRSAKQDGAFNHIAAYFRASQAADESTIASNERLVVPAVEAQTKETGTTIDPAWQSLKKYVVEELSLFTDSFKTLREDVCIPLYTSCSESEHRLKILFSEANILEAQAAKGKSVVERTKSASISAFQKYEQLRTQLTQAAVVLQPGEISRIVQSQSESEDSRLDLDEAETSFQTIVREYETRMPQIIASIRALNQERIVQLKSSLEAWVQSKRQVLLGLMQQLDKVSQRVEEINAEKDLVSFSEGTTDFWTAARNTATAAASTSPPPEDAAAEAAAADTAATETAVPVEADPAAAADATSPMVVSVTLDSSSSSASAAPLPSATPPLPSSSPALPTIGEAGQLAVESPPAAAASGARLTVSASSPSQAKRHSASVRSSPGGGEVLCYPLYLWGIDGFERAAVEAQTTRKVMKELIACMSAWFEVVDTKSKKIHGSLRALPELLSIPGIGSHQRAVWETLKNRSLASSKALGDFGLSMLKLVSALSLTKGELKMSIARFREHRITLEKEVQAAAEVRAKSFDKKERTAKALLAYQKQQAVNPAAAAAAAAGAPNATGATTPLVSSGSFVAAAIAKQNAAAAAAAAESVSSPSHLGGHGLMSQKQLELQSSLFERLNREAKEAAHEHELNERNAQAVQRKHDICVARLLRLFEKKERNGQTELKRTFGVLAESWAQKVLAVERSSDESLSAAVKRTQLVQDWQEFVEQTIKQQQINAAAGTVAASSSSAAAAAAAPTTVSAVVASGSTSAAAAITAVDFSKSLGATGYVPVASLLQCSISWVRTISTLLAELSAADDAEVKLLRKFAFKIRACRANTTVAAAAAAFEALLDRMADVTEDAARVGLDTAAPFSKLKSSLKSHAKAFDSKFADQEKALNKAVEERKLAHAAELRAAEALRVAREKVSQAAAAPGDAPVKKGLFSSFMSTPLKDLQSKEAAAAKEAEKAAATTQEKEMGLLAATSKRATELRELLHEMQTVEHRRWISQSDLLTALLVKHSLHLDKLQTLFHNYSERVVSIDVDADLTSFIRHNQQALKPPEYVYEDYSKYIDAVAQAASSKSPSASAQEEMITAPIPLPGSPFVFAKRIMTGSASLDKPAGSPAVAGGRGRSVTSHSATGPSGKPLPVLAQPHSRAPLHLPSATTSTGTGTTTGGSVVRSVTEEPSTSTVALQPPAAGKEESLSSAQRPVEHSTSSAPTGGAAAAASSPETAADSAHPEMSVSEEFALPVGRTRGMTVDPRCPPSTEPIEPNPSAGALVVTAEVDEDVQDPETGAWVKHHGNAALNESGVDEATAGTPAVGASDSAAAVAAQPLSLQTPSSMSEMHPAASPASTAGGPQLTAAELNAAFLSPNSVVSSSTSCSSTTHAAQEAAAAQQQEQVNVKLEEAVTRAEKQEDAGAVETVSTAAPPVADPVAVASEAAAASDSAVVADPAAVLAAAELAPAAAPVADSAPSSSSSSSAAADTAAAPLSAVAEDASSSSLSASDSSSSAAAADSASASLPQLPPALPSSKPTPRTSVSSASRPAGSYTKPTARPKGPAPLPPPAGGLTSDSPKPIATSTPNEAPEADNSTPAAEAAAETAPTAQVEEPAAAAAAASSSSSEIPPAAASS